MEVVYSTTHHPLAKGRRFQNPRHFVGPLDGAKKVYLTSDLPKIAAAYQAVGVEVVRVGAQPTAKPMPRKPAKRRTRAKASSPVEAEVECREV
jgi:hypothetical protein